MADRAGNLVTWLKNFKPNDLVWIDEGGLTLEGNSTKGKKPVYLYNEVGLIQRVFSGL